MDRCPWSARRLPPRAAPTRVRYWKQALVRAVKRRSTPVKSNEKRSGSPLPLTTFISSVWAPRRRFIRDPAEGGLIALAPVDDDHASVTISALSTRVLTVALEVGSFSPSATPMVICFDLQPNSSAGFALFPLRSISRFAGTSNPSSVFGSAAGSTSAAGAAAAVGVEACFRSRSNPPSLTKVRKSEFHSNRRLGWW